MRIIKNNFITMFALSSNTNRLIVNKTLNPITIFIYININNL